MIQTDFEKYVKHQLNIFGSFNFQQFGTYAVSILNFYTGSSLLTKEDKLEASIFLTSLYNKGMQNRISDEDILEIANMLAAESTLDYNVIKPVFD